MIAVIACGNLNRSDDGVGSYVVSLLRDEFAGRSGVTFLDSGTDGLAVMFAARGCRHVILVDACRSGSEAGAIFDVPAERLAAPCEASLSTHGLRWNQALYAGSKMYGEAFSKDIRVFLVEGADFGLGTELSPKVALAANALAKTIGQMIASGVELEAA